MLFFAMNSLHKMHTYYMFSLNSFIFFFLRGISTAGISPAAEKEDEGDSMADDASVGSFVSAASIGA